MPDGQKRTSVTTTTTIAHLKKKKKRSYLKRHIDFVCRVCDPIIKRSVRHKLVDSASRSQVYAICECIKNVVTCVCPISPQVKQSLQKFRRPLTALSKPKKDLSVEERKKVLNQRGSGFFLPAILSAIASHFLTKN